MKQRYLTKSRFKMAMECPSKLFFDGKSEYANKNLQDSFLLALAEGGFQVGELAKCYISGGYNIKTLNDEDALRRTDELLKQEKAIIYEAAFRYKDCFIRVDILIKDGNRIDLIEVKAKSIDEATNGSFLTRNGSIVSGWKPYILDAAFQKYVLTHALPKYSISAFLMLADKQAKCPSDGLNQKFKIITNSEGKKQVNVSNDISEEDISVPILCRINVDSCCDIIYCEKYGVNFDLDFDEYVTLLASRYKQDIKISPVPSSICANCEFKATEDDEMAGLKNGFKECWRECYSWNNNDFQQPTIFDIWNFRKKDEYIKNGCIKLADITEDDISPKNDSKPGISASERQWLQVQKTQEKDYSIWIDIEILKAKMDSWVYPLHFIDFETTMTAIPFNKGRHPYEGIAFQYSHHVVYEDGKIEHKGQYINTIPGVFPNYEFIRNLKKELSQDNGSIFRYAAHENTFLNIIYTQLINENSDVPDRDELCAFIRTITQSTKKQDDQWVGHRNMIDMLELVKRYYYDPATKGSNSIKQVLPAMLNSSEYLQGKYCRPIYGITDGIPSLNYENWKWIEYENGHVVDPYKLLPKMFQDIDDKDYLLLSESNELKDGGAALTAYARMQFEEMSDYERDEIQKALLKYCELDTMAMVMIYEGWKEMIKNIFWKH